VDKKDHLNLVFEFTKALANLDNTELLMDDVLGMLKSEGFDYAAVKVVDPVSEEIIIRNASGLSNEARQKGRYKVGEGITGTVVKTGEPIVIRNVGEDSRFLNRTEAKTRNDSAFYCYPIKIGDSVIGALSAMESAPDASTFKKHTELLQTLAPIIGQSLLIHERFERDRIKLEQENLHLRSELQSKRRLSNFIGNSSKMQQVFDQIRMVANSSATVLIQGENGTGKELVADTIHYSSSRSSGPFIKVNCAALPENLLESELFGHEKGSFTGAMQQKKGRFELADQGTLFLDEIGEINPSIQIKLLRFLQSREFERVGGVKTIQSNLRIICATNKNLEEEIKKGNFREDLYYRLNVFPVFVPSLRERKTDITLLADFFLDKYSRENNKLVRRLSTPAIEMLHSYHWPGNVRELENCIERAILVCNSDTIRAQDLPPSLQTSETTSSINEEWSMPEAVTHLETEMITEALKSLGGHQGKTAKKLGITERQLGYKIKKYNIG
jgi:Nif-specific regulatory protein